MSLRERKGGEGERVISLSSGLESAEVRWRCRWRQLNKPVAAVFTHLASVQIRNPISNPKPIPSGQVRSDQISVKLKFNGSRGPETHTHRERCLSVYTEPKKGYKPLEMVRSSGLGSVPNYLAKKLIKNT